MGLGITIQTPHVLDYGPLIIIIIIIAIIIIIIIIIIITIITITIIIIIIIIIVGGHRVDSDGVGRFKLEIA